MLKVPLGTVLTCAKCAETHEVVEDKKVAEIAFLLLMGDDGGVRSEPRCRKCLPPLTEEAWAKARGDEYKQADLVEKWRNQAQQAVEAGDHKALLKMLPDVAEIRELAKKIDDLEKETSTEDDDYL